MGLLVGQRTLLCGMWGTSAFSTNSLKPANPDNSLGHENSQKSGSGDKNKILKEENSLTIWKAGEVSIELLGWAPGWWELPLLWQFQNYILF